MSQVTTHVLETSTGQPAQGIKIRLEQPISEQSWATLSEGITDSDGRVSNLLGKRTKLTVGKYRLVFLTGAYYQQRNIQTFYPEVKIIFEITDGGHYHVPLLLNPYGYSTYRGS